MVKRVKCIMDELGQINVQENMDSQIYPETRVEYKNVKYHHESENTRRIKESYIVLKKNKIGTQR